MIGLGLLASRVPLPLLLAALLLAVGRPAEAGGDGLLALPDPLALSYPGAAEHVEPPPRGSKGSPDPDADAAKAGDDVLALMEQPPPVPLEAIPNHRQMMRDIVQELSRYARERDPGFLIVARGGLDLLHKGAREARWARLKDVALYPGSVGTPMRPYLTAIDGLVIDGLYCGRRAFDRPTDPADRKALLHFGAMVRAAAGSVLAIDHCRPATSREAAADAGGPPVAVFANADPDGALDAIPARRPRQENPAPVGHLDQARNLLPVLRADRNRDDWLLALQDSNHDVLIVDAFPGGRALTAAEVESLKFKRLGARRLVLAAVPVARAEDDMPYWQAGWQPGRPDWLGAPLPGRPGATRPLYWRAEWKEILGRHFKAAMDLGFDGVMLDALDAYRAFEAEMPLPRLSAEAMATPGPEGPAPRPAGRP